MIGIKGTHVKLHHAGEAWCRARTAYPIACPDGVTRCIAFPNWRWGRWVPAFDPDAFTSGPFQRFVADAWQFAQALAPAFDASSVMAEQLLHQVDRHHCRSRYQPANDNPPPDFWEAWLQVPPGPCGRAAGDGQM